LIGPLHDLSKLPKRILHGFDLYNSCILEDHINNFYLVVRIMNVEYEYIVSRIFPYTFENKACTWYSNFPTRSNMSWDAFERDFLNKFGEEKTPTTLLRELITIKMEKKEKIKYFT
jgi:hypothetical protein